jgi:hypothetical protein
MHHQLTPLPDSNWCAMAELLSPPPPPPPPTHTCGVAQAVPIAPRQRPNYLARQHTVPHRPLPHLRVGVPAAVRLQLCFSYGEGAAGVALKAAAAAAHVARSTLAMLSVHNTALHRQHAAGCVDKYQTTDQLLIALLSQRAGLASPELG